MRTYGFSEDYYRQASEKDVKFIRYEPDGKPEVREATERDKSVLRVAVTDEILGQELAIDADYLMLAAAVVPSAETPAIAGHFKVTPESGWFLQRSPCQIKTRGVCNRRCLPLRTGPLSQNISETINQAYGAAGRVLTLLSHDTVVASGSVCGVDERKCMGVRGLHGGLHLWRH